MSDSTRTVDLGERIAHALVERRPQPTRDFDARLERASEPREPARHSQMTALLAVAALACAILVVVVTRPDSVSRPGTTEQLEQRGQPPPSAPLAPPTLPHDGKFTANQCNQCHRPAPRPPAAHEPNGSFPLVGGHRAVSCATCHAPKKKLERECTSCHTPGSWKLKK